MICTSGKNLIDFVGEIRFATVLVDPPWRFTNKTGKIAPEHKRLARYLTMTVEQIKALPVAQVATPTAHLYLWCQRAFA
jgi:N6-adenosine-specific RNA methylase IME4